jgi:hypothetical protein
VAPRGLAPTIASAEDRRLRELAQRLQVRDLIEERI